MPTSQNGYSANDRSVIGSFTVPGTGQRVSLRKGDTSVILLDIAAWVHANIEPIDRGIFDDWGYAERTIRGSSTTLSNHASGTALDLNATQHPLGVRGTWSADERRRINARLAQYEGCIRWGDNYTGRVDGMHFEIDRGAAACRVVADKIRAGRLGGIAVLPSAPPAPPRPKVEPVIQNFPIAGTGALELNTPIKGASALYKAAYLSVRSNAGGGKVDIYWGMTGKGGRGEAHWTLNANERRWVELSAADAVDQATVHYALGAGAGAVTVEFAPK